VKALGKLVFLLLLQAPPPSLLSRDTYQHRDAQELPPLRGYSHLEYSSRASEGMATTGAEKLQASTSLRAQYARRNTSLAHMYLDDFIQREIDRRFEEAKQKAWQAQEQKAVDGDKRVLAEERRQLEGHERQIDELATR
jgi:hypothetical protein